ncbi:MAG: DUF2017 family protein [Acidimicrobiales bacterium]
MSVFSRRPLRRGRQGRFVVGLGGDERAVLASLPGQMRELLAGRSDPSLRRLFPPAYSSPGDEEHQEEYARLMGDDLLARHQDALDVLESTAQAEELTAPQLEAWLRALNTVRLVVGSRLDVGDDDEPDPSASPLHGLYYFLGYLQECGLDALVGPGPGGE